MRGHGVLSYEIALPIGEVMVIASRPVQGKDGLLGGRGPSNPRLTAGNRRRSARAGGGGGSTHLIVPQYY